MAYQKAVFDLFLFDVEDVITTSGELSLVDNSPQGYDDADN